MYYITKIDSETGLKLEQVVNKIRVCNKEAVKAISRFGTAKRIPSYFKVAGGVNAIVEPKIIDNTIRLDKKSKHKETYVPNLKTKEGKSLKEEWENLPTVSYEELNSVVGYEEDFVSHIGYALNNDDYYAIIVRSEWNIKMPLDCEEITTTKYKEMFKIKD